MKHLKSFVGLLLVLTLMLSSCVVTGRRPASNTSDDHTHGVSDSHSDDAVSTSDPIVTPGESDDNPASSPVESNPDPELTSGRPEDDPGSTSGESGDDPEVTPGESGSTDPDDPDVSFVPGTDPDVSDVPGTDPDVHVHNFVGLSCTEPGECVCGERKTALGHDYAAATCTSPSICSRCKSTTGTALGHNYSAATCTAAATCSRCKATNGKALGHSYSAATCTAAATCTRCKATNGKALGHTNTGATCTEAGICSRCGAKGTALGHSFSAATCALPKTCSRCKLTEGNPLGHNYASGKCKKCGDTNGPLSVEDAKLFKNKLTDEQNAEALAIAREYARQILEMYPDDNDYFDRIAEAAWIVSCNYDRSKHTESGLYYAQAYGVFVLHEASCAGCTRALGLILTCMGYQWKHVNENAYTHQWVTLTINGEEIWADGQVGWAGYGTHPLG